ncbi:MAG TPA: CopD family protein [Candidatus Sulfotelmatobacter sp.]|jgi:putative copper resistance protein D|nr:CopD family protein [Candidatus Sulfotelmatobacter sp.]
MADLLSIFGFLVVLLRAAILCFQTILVGGLIFLCFVASNDSLRPEELTRPAWKFIRLSGIGLALCQLAFLIVNSLVLWNSTDISIREMLGANFAIAGIVAIVASLAVALWPAGLRESVNRAVLVPAMLIVASSVVTSHSFSRMEGRAVLVGLTALHYLATASWIGGLPYLLLSMKRISEQGIRIRISQRFSRLAQISVGVLFLAGLGMSLVFVGSWNALYGTAYGIMVGTKVVLFVCLLLLGAANYFIVRGVGAASAAGSTSLIRFGEVEIGIGLTVILAAASLTSQPPGADLTEDRVSLHEIAVRYAPRMPRLTSPPLGDISPAGKAMERKAKLAGVKVPAAFMPGESFSHPETPGDIAWSEYNHAWAGLIVFFMGLLALLSYNRYFPWAKIWPLMFLGLAVFLFLRADPENWPLGANGFWASFREPDVLQHRAVVLLIIVFALFQWAVETNRVKSQASALVFPGVCAIGGIVLLTHMHGATNIKQEMLIELSHTPLAIFGIVAGWARWLELRLPQENNARKYLAWVWPVCFIFVGLILMDYHEA